MKCSHIVVLIVSIGFAGNVNALTDKRFEACKASLLKAQQIDVLNNLDWRPPREPQVVVGATFYIMPFDAKKGFVDIVNCFLVSGKSDKHMSFDLLDWQTGKRVGRYVDGRLNIQ
jgi:hypothetical protein